MNDMMKGGSLALLQYTKFLEIFRLVSGLSSMIFLPTEAPSSVTSKKTLMAVISKKML